MQATDSFPACGACGGFRDIGVTDDRSCVHGNDVQSRCAACDADPNDSLIRAIAYLGAVEVEPERYAWRWTPHSDYAVATANNLAAWDGKNSATLNLAIMPAWWSPEQRFAWHVEGYEHGPRFASHLEAMRYAQNKYGGSEKAFDAYCDTNQVIERITADLQTGQEVAV